MKHTTLLLESVQNDGKTHIIKKMKCYARFPLSLIPISIIHNSYTSTFFPFSKLKQSNCPKSNSSRRQNFYEVPISFLLPPYVHLDSNPFNQFAQFPKSYLFNPLPFSHQVSNNVNLIHIRNLGLGGGNEIGKHIPKFINLETNFVI